MSDLLSALLNAQPTLVEAPPVERTPLGKPERDSGYTPTSDPVTESSQVQVQPPVAASELTLERWDISGSTDTGYQMNVGRVWLSEVSGNIAIADATANISFVADGAIWLEYGNRTLGNLTLMSGAMPSEIYEFTSGNMSTGRKILYTIDIADLGDGSTELANATGNGSSFWVYKRVGDYDLKGYTVVESDADGNGTFCTELAPY